MELGVVCDAAPGSLLHVASSWLTVEQGRIRKSDGPRARGTISDAVYRDRRKQLRDFLEFMNERHGNGAVGRMRLRDLSMADIEEFNREVVRRGYSASQVNKRMQIVKAVIDRAGRPEHGGQTLPWNWDSRDTSHGKPTQERTLPSLEHLQGIIAEGEPTVVNGAPQVPMQGTSLLYTFNDADAPERHTTQYFEIFGNRAIYRDGWLARTIHYAPWQTGKRTPLHDDVWDLYYIPDDFSLADNLAAGHPEKLEEMKALFMTEAAKYHVFPIDDRLIERMNPKLAGRPDLIGDRTSLTLHEGMDGMLENTFINVKNRSMTITAEIEIPEGGASGAILVQGSRYGGWSLHMRDGKPAYEYNFLGLQRYVVESPDALPAGKATVVLDFEYDGGGLGKGGDATLSVNGTKVAEGRIERTQPNVFSADETADVGLDNQTPVAQGIGYGPKETRFTGKIHQVALDVK